MRLLLTILFITVTYYAAAQEDWKNLSVDDIFSKARVKAFNGERMEAREMLLYVLDKSPDYHDVRILYARTFAWDGNRSEARKELQAVLTKDSKNEDALNALIDVELWDDKYDQALTLTDYALLTYPNHEDFLFKRAKSLAAMQKDDEALLTLNRLLSINPANASALNLIKSIKQQSLRYTAGVSYGVDLFSRTFDPAHYAAAQLGRNNAWGSSIFRLNYANRFNANGIQPEVDLYPRIANGIYAYLNYGFSSTDLFPEHRAGAEIFTKLPKSFEASAGIRYLYFDSDTKVNIITGSVGWYYKNYWFSIRPYITPDEDTGTSFSATLFVRRYFENADQYFGFNAGLGFSPDERRFQSGAGFTSDGIYILRSQRSGISWSKEFSQNFILIANLDIIRQELLFDIGEYVMITSISASVRKRF